MPARAVSRSATRNASRRGRPALSQPAAARPTRRSSSASRALNASPSDGSHGNSSPGIAWSSSNPRRSDVAILTREVTAFDERDGVRDVCERQPAGKTRAVGALGRIGRRHELGRGTAVEPSAPPQLLGPRHDRDSQLGGDAVHAGEPRHDVEHALPGAARDVRLELRPVLDQVAARARRAERVLGARVRPGEPHGRLGGVAPLEAEPVRDAPGDVGVVERERALDACAEDRDVVPVAPRDLGHRGEIEQRGDVDPLAALGRRDDRAGAVRRRHRERRRARLEVLPRRVPEVEPVDPDAEALAAEA